MGAMWELFEFAVDLTGVYVSQLGLADTMADIAAGVLGGAAGSYYRYSVDKGNG
jgi:hypothetical protein